MAVEKLSIQGKPLEIRRAVVAPVFGDQKVLTSEPWTYVGLWLRRNATNTDAAFFWDQAREFYAASRGLPITASPLPLYYCFLNATKALLASKALVHSAHHGLTGKSLSLRASLSNEQITIKGGGVLPALIKYLGETELQKTYTLREIFQNLAFVHRAYCLSYSSKDLFIPLADCQFVRKRGSSEAWLMAGAEAKFDDARILGTLPQGYERDGGFTDEVVIRKKKRFRWESGRGKTDANLKRLISYHRKLRIDVTYISGVGRWYMRRHLAGACIINRHTSTLILAAMHRLSELSRYDPLRLSKILDSQRSWLLAEFVEMAPLQFIDEMACEITGQEIDVPGIHRGHILRASV